VRPKEEADYGEGKEDGKEFPQLTIKHGKEESKTKPPGYDQALGESSKEDQYFEKCGNKATNKV